MARTVRKTYSLDQRSAELIEQYAGELHLSESAFVSLMVTQIDRVLSVGLKAKKKREAVKSGGD